MSREETYQGIIQFLKCDVDSAKDVAQACSIQAMPTFKVYQNGKEIEAIQGWNENKLRTLLKKLVLERKSS
jgi:thioredoxin-like negative regulator of GroEL